jgi:hypothetical protein
MKPYELARLIIEYYGDTTVLETSLLGFAMWLEKHDTTPNPARHKCVN